MAISPISFGATGVGSMSGPGGIEFSPFDKTGGAADKPFASMMNQILGEVSQSQSKMDQDVTQMATGQAQNVHEIVLNVAQADLMFRLVMEVRDRLIASYQDVMRMQI